MNNLQQAYKAVRALSLSLESPMSAQAALNFARHSLARDYNSKDKNRYYRAALFGYTPAGKPFGGEFWKLGSSQMVWVEKPDAQGMRDCGDAGDIVRLHHRGWYIDIDQQDTARGCVYRWGRFYIPGIRDPHNNGPVILAWSDRELCSENARHRDADNPTLRDCAWRADRLAEIYAEEEREYHRASSAGAQFAACGDEAKGLRRSVRELLRDIRTATAGGVQLSAAICEALRAKVRADLEALQELREERAKLAAGEYESDNMPGWNTRDKTLLDAFCDAAGITVKQWEAI